MLKTRLLLLLVASCGTLTAQTSIPQWNTPKPGVKEVQVPLASLKPSATFKVGGTADWVLLTEDAVWITTTKPYSLRRIDPATNKVIASVKLSGEACSGLEFGFGSVWAPVCGKKPALVRVDAHTNKISAVLPIAPAGREGGITASGDSIWMVTDKKGTLTRIDPSTNSARQKITIPLGSFNPLFCDGIVWITGVESNVLVPVDASTGGVLASIPVGSTPRFLTAGGSSVWTLNQGEGTVSRVDTSTKKVTATIKAGIPGLGGDICYGADSVWATVFDVPLTQIDAKSNDVLRQWVGKGGDSVRVGFGSIWLTDYYRGLLWRIDVRAPEAPNSKPSASEKLASKLVTQNPEAYELYLKGRSYWSKRTLPDLETAISYFNQAIAKDPGYALAYSALADAYAVLPDYGGSPIEDISKSNAAARKALELDATLARPHAAMGYTQFRHAWDFAGAEAEFKKALALDPDDALTHAWYAENIGTIGGREQEALAEVNLAHQLDPLSPVISYDLGNIHILARRYDEGIAACKKLANENPTFAMAHYCLSDAYWGKRNYSESIKEYEAGSQLAGDRNDFEYALAMEEGFRSAGWKGALRKGIEVSVAQHKTAYSSSYTIATMHAQLGEKDQAFQWLDTALQEHDQGLIGLKTDYTLDPIRSDPRFAELVRKIGLPSGEKRVSKQGTQNPEAYALYVKGRSYWDKQTRADLETAISYFNQAIAEDPGYALAYEGLSEAYSTLPDFGDSPSSDDIPKAIAAARKAIELDPILASPHLNLGGIKMGHEWDFAGGEAEFKKALELDPNNAYAHERYADNLGLLAGREKDALAEVNRAHQLDPLSPDISVEVGIVYTDARRFDEAIDVCKKVASENPTFATAHTCLGFAYWGKHLYAPVIEEWKTYGQLSGDRNESEFASALEQGFRSAGWKGALAKGIELRQAQRKTGYASAYEIGTMYADLGDIDRAFRWLNTAIKEHAEGVMGLQIDFLLDPLRSDPRFAELVRKVGLPQ